MILSLFLVDFFLVSRNIIGRKIRKSLARKLGQKSKLEILAEFFTHCLHSSAATMKCKEPHDVKQKIKKIIVHNKRLTLCSNLSICSSSHLRLMPKTKNIVSLDAKSFAALFEKAFFHDRRSNEPGWSLGRHFDCVICVSVIVESLLAGFLAVTFEGNHPLFV